MQAQSSIFKKKIVVVGATGMVGRTILRILSERGIPERSVVALASERSTGQEINYGTGKIVIQNLANFSFKGTDYALFSPGSKVSEIYAPKAANEGALVIDNTSHFRTFDDVPLIIPEVNGAELSKRPKLGIIANPNCVLMQLAVALKPLHDQFNLKAVSLSAYQSVSGAGKVAVDEMFEQTNNFLKSGTNLEPDIFKRNMAFNVLAEIDEIMDNGFTKEEWKIRCELRKVLSKDIAVSATCVRVPVVNGHAIAAHAYFETDADLNKARELLKSAPGVALQETTTTPHYVAGRDPVYVSRLRQDPDDKKSLLLWICADNLRKGAALNAVQIMECAESFASK